MPKRGSAFYGDTGTKFTGPAREDIEKQESSGAGHPGNNVDFSQRTAQSEADEYTEQAERMTRSMERSDLSLGMPREQFVEQMAELLRNPSGNGQGPPQPQEPEEEETLSRKADDKFWNSEEPKRVMPRKL